MVNEAEKELAAILLKILQQSTSGGMGNHHMCVPRNLLDEASETLAKHGY